MAQTVDAPLERDQDLSLPPAHSAPAALDIAPFAFVPAPTTARPLTPDQPIPQVLPRRRVRLDWYESAVVLLIVSCAALCMYRLLWAIQP